MRRFFWRTFSGRIGSVEGVDSVRFESGHVVFFDSDGGIIRAEINADVQKMVEVFDPELSMAEARQKYIGEN